MPRDDKDFDQAKSNAMMVSTTLTTLDREDHPATKVLGACLAAATLSVVKVRVQSNGKDWKDFCRSAMEMAISAISEATRDGQIEGCANHCPETTAANEPGRTGVAGADAGRTDASGGAA